MFAYNLLQNVLELEEKNDVNPIIFAIDKRFTELTIQNMEHFSLGNILPPLHPIQQRPQTWTTHMLTTTKCTDIKTITDNIDT